MNELESFFSEVSSSGLNAEEFMDGVMYIGLSEWHLTPEQILSLDVPLVYRMLLRRKKLNEAK
jgi:hypothetical protein